MAEVIEVPKGYSCVREISTGVLGSVVEMIENSTQMHYAGKIIQCKTQKDTEQIDREVSRLRKFAHPGIVGLKEVASMDNSKVIVMELGEQSLADIVRDHPSRGVLAAREVVYRVMVDVSSALNLMHNHENGANAHGDVKMENILLFPGGHFKLCDLGAAESEDLKGTRSVMSHLWVSPERIESETGQATCSSDVWALGIVLHWLLFGEPPFKSESLLKLGQEISSFRVSQIGSDCGGEERALLMRMLEPKPETRVTSCQLCSFGVFHCLVNTPSALWSLKDADEKELHSKNENLKMEIEIENRSQQQAEEDLNIEREDRKKDQERMDRLERELAELRSRQVQPLPQPSTRPVLPANIPLCFPPPPPAQPPLSPQPLRSPSPRRSPPSPPATPPQHPGSPHEQPTPGTAATPAEPAHSQPSQRSPPTAATPPQHPRSPLEQPTPGTAATPAEPAHSQPSQRSPPPHRSPPTAATPPQHPRSPLEQPTPGTGRQFHIGTAAIELFDRDEWTVSGIFFFTKSETSQASLVSFEFGAVVARLSLTIRKGPNNDFAIGIISSSLCNKALTTYFLWEKEGAGWELHPNCRCTQQNNKLTNFGSACLGGRGRQRIVLEADGREGKRTLKLSQDGETQPVFFTNIPVPFRFAVCITEKDDSIAIESVEIVSDPQMVGGTIPVEMDE